MIPKFLDRSKLPHKPGVYLYKNGKNKIIYVGKAIDLYHRVASYFSSHPKNVRIETMVLQIKSVETIIVQSDLEALILEANLIKKYLPQFNVRLTDDKDYLYIKVTKEEFPRILTARKKELHGSLRHFGPFPSARTVKNTLKLLRKVFPWCSNPNGKKPCFYYHISLCPGPCADEISKEEYGKIIKRFCSFLDGNKKVLIDELITEMNKYAENKKYEEAGKIKKLLSRINYLTQPNNIQAYLENPNFLEDERKKALELLKDILKLKNIPKRIEGYDISNIQGHEAVGSMVVLTDGEIDKGQYRKFKIRISDKPNDVAMMREMIQRRLKHFEWPLPDLILVDGGSAQVNAVLKEILSKNIPLFGLAKRMEWLYSASGEEIRLPKSSPALHLLQKLRDEAHRFAITYYRKLHRQATFT